MSSDIAYKELLIFKLLIRRISFIVFFKVMFTMKRVEIQMNPIHDTKLKIYSNLQKIMVIERVYLFFVALLMLNIGFVITMFVEQEYYKEM